MLTVKHRLRVFENKMLGRICGPKRAELTGSRKTMHSGEPHYLYFSPNITLIKSRRMR
jgi:hypothetical protein